jgi:aldose 1-epimerase
MMNSTFRFQIIEEEFGTKTSFKLYDSESGEFVSILPYLGGSINQMVLRNGKELVEIIDGYASPEDAQENLMTTFKGSNLFPFPNRIADGKYTFRGQNLQLPLNFPQEKNAIHGLIYDKELKVIDKEDGEIGCKLLFEYKADETEGYPFQYHLKVSYRFTENHGFECKVKVTNLIDQSIPVGHGWHPYFRLGNVPIKELYLSFPAKEILKVDKRNIPTGETIPYGNFNKSKLIGDTILDNCFHLTEEDGKAEITIMNSDQNMGYKIWQETGIYKYNYLQVYTPPHRRSIAIEPMTCAPDAFNNKSGLIVLSPLESFTAQWGIIKL